MFFKLMKIMLADLGQHYANNSCNEFNLERIIPDRDKRCAFMKQVLAISEDPDQAFDPNNDYIVVSDLALLHWLESRINWLEKELTGPLPLHDLS